MAKTQDASRFRQASAGTIVCRREDGGCGEWLILSPFAYRFMSAMIFPGHSLHAVLMDAHVASGHKLGTKADADEHGCEIYQ